MRAWVAIFLAGLKLELAEHLQYRVALFLWVVGTAVEPVVYLVVWAAVVAAQGGAVGSYGINEFGAYYVVWIWVSTLTRGPGAGGAQELVRQGTLSAYLAQPSNPYVTWMAGLFAFKITSLVFLAPVTALLAVVFRVSLSPSWWQLVLFVPVVLVSALTRFTLEWAIGLLSFWVVRVDALFQLYATADLILSGRLVPLALLPGWAQAASQYLPFHWLFGFPIEIVLGRVTPPILLQGVCLQLTWLVLAALLCRGLWLRGVRRYAAVGG